MTKFCFRYMHWNQTNFILRLWGHLSENARILVVCWDRQVVCFQKFRMLSPREARKFKTTSRDSPAAVEVSFTCFRFCNTNHDQETYFCNRSSQPGRTVVLFSTEREKILQCSRSSTLYLTGRTVLRNYALHYSSLSQVIGIAIKKKNPPLHGKFSYWPYSPSHKHRKFQQFRKWVLIVNTKSLERCNFSLQKDSSKRNKEATTRISNFQMKHLLNAKILARAASLWVVSEHWRAIDIPQSCLNLRLLTHMLRRENFGLWVTTLCIPTWKGRKVANTSLKIPPRLSLSGEISRLVAELDLADGASAQNSAS